MSTTTGKFVVALAVLGVAVAILNVLFVIWILTARPGSGDGHTVLGSPAETFAITGSLSEPIEPGVLVPLDLEIFNPHEVPMTISDLSVTVESVTAPNATTLHPCSVDDFDVEQMVSTTDVTIGARATSSLEELDVSNVDLPKVGMLNTSANQDGCKGASLTLTYSASGRFEQ